MNASDPAVGTGLFLLRAGREMARAYRAQQIDERLSRLRSRGCRCRVEPMSGCLLDWDGRPCPHQDWSL